MPAQGPRVAPRGWAVTASTLTVLLGGARSGKSALAVRWGRAYGGPVTVVATAEAGDDEMRARIAAHRAERPPGWTIVEEPRDLRGALRSADDEAMVIVDCLTLWVATVMADDDDATVLSTAGALAAAAAGRPAPTVVVSNEVGQGIVPVGAATRRYRDLLGGVNAAVVAQAAHAWLMVAGRVVALVPPPLVPPPPHPG